MGFAAGVEGGEGLAVVVPGWEMFWRDVACCARETATVYRAVYVIVLTLSWGTTHRCERQFDFQHFHLLSVNIIFLNRPHYTTRFGHEPRQ